jgi:hypothetical protein
MRLDWRGVERLPDEPALRWQAGLLDARNDGAVEVAFTLAPGELAGLRARAGRVLVGVRDANAVVAFASFDPAFPGAAPFRVVRPTLARALCEALRPHARSQFSFLRILVEGDAGLVAGLKGAGAESVLDLYRMEGPLAE